MQIDSTTVTIFLAIGIVLLSIYCMLIALKLGFKPKEGVIVPIYNPPDNLSAAEVSYIKKKGFDNSIVAAIIVDIAIKGYLVINRVNREYYCLTIKDKNITLTANEQEVADLLFKESDSFDIKVNDFQSEISIYKISRKVFSLLKKTVSNKYFEFQSKYLFISLVISLIFILPSIFYAIPLNLQTVYLTSIIIFFLTIFIVFYYPYNSITNMRIILAGFILLAILFTIITINIDAFLLPFLFSYFFFLINLIFAYFLKRPTAEGLKTLRNVDGFIMFLNATEKNRLDMSKAPPQDAHTYDKYLPFVIALGIEENWSRSHFHILNNQTYHPSWFTGNFSPRDFASKIDSCIHKYIKNEAR